MLNKYLERRKTVVSTTENFTHATKRFSPITLGYTGLVSHLAIYVPVVGLIAYWSYVETGLPFKGFAILGALIFYLSFVGGSFVLLGVFYLFGALPFFFSSSAVQRLTNEHHTLKNANNGFIWADKIIFFGIMAIQLSIALGFIGYFLVQKL